jgi:hypothetical protein
MGQIIPFATAGDQRSLLVRKSTFLSRARADHRISDAEYRIYAAALDYVHRGSNERFGMLWPSVTSLANAAGGKARRTVQTALTKLEDFGYLTLISDRRGGRRHVPRGSAAATTIYALPDLNSAADLPANSAADVPISATDVPVNSATDVPQSFREEPMEETSLRDVSLRKHTARRLSPGHDDLISWAPRDKDCAIARQNGYSAAWIADQAERFRDHHLAKGNALRDINAAWRNWQRVAFDRDECPPDPPPSVSSNTAIDDAIRGDPFGQEIRRLIEIIGENAYRSFFGGVSCGGVRGGTVYLSAPNRFIRAKLIERFEHAIRACWGVEHVEIAVVTANG